MALSQITGGEVVFDPSSGGTGWSNAKYTLDAAPSGTNRFRFAYKAYNETPWSGQVADYEAMNNSFWLGLRFSNSHLSTITLPGNADGGEGITAADDFLGQYAGQGTGAGSGSITISGRSTIGGVSCWWFDYNGIGSVDQGHWFSYGVPSALVARPNVPNTFYTDVMNIPDGATNGAIRTYGWEVYKHETLNTVYLKLYKDDTSLLDANLLDVFEGANLDWIKIITPDGTPSNWIDVSGNMSFPRYFICQWPACNVDRTFPAVYNRFIIPAIAYQYLQDS